MKASEAFVHDVIDIKLCADRLIEGLGNGRRMFTVEDQMLYLIVNEGPIAPRDIVKKLNIVKTNLASLANTMIRDGMIEKRHLPENKKEIEYIATEKGKKILQEGIAGIAARFVNIDKEVAQKISSVSKVLKKLG